jgi:hypothetical protein
MGMIEGVTTNPTPTSGGKRYLIPLIKEICKII